MSGTVWRKAVSALFVVFCGASVLLALAPLDQFTLADFDRTVAVNVRSVFVATQAAAKHMKIGRAHV